VISHPLLILFQYSDNEWFRQGSLRYFALDSVYTGNLSGISGKKTSFKNPLSRVLYFLETERTINWKKHFVLVKFTIVKKRQTTDYSGFFYVVYEHFSFLFLKPFSIIYVLENISV